MIPFNRLHLCFLPLLFATMAYAQPVYRCDGPGGPSFSNSPCDDGSEEIDVRNPPPGGQLAAPGSTPAPSPTPDTDESGEDASESAETPSPCRNYTSTEARRLRIGEQVERGMSREQVRESWGDPVDVFPGSVEIWTYDNRYYGRVVSVRRVHFEDGCVTGVEVTRP